MAIPLLILGGILLLSRGKKKKAEPRREAEARGDTFFEPLETEEAIYLGDRKLKAAQYLEDVQEMSSLRSRELRTRRR